MKNNRNIVAIGGGTGLSVLLSGLKNFTKNLTAIVNVVDDGGGSGRLREDLGMLPPGDIRACLVALSNTENDLQKLFQYRFDTGELGGQSFGNLFLAAMNEVFGSFEIAVQKTSDILAITGQVFPMTLEDISLIADLDDGSSIIGESIIPDYVRKHNKKIKKVRLSSNNPKPLDESLKKIKEADIILVGPGSLYTSIIPNFLVTDIAESLKKANAPIIYIANIMSQAGETDNYTIKDHYQAIVDHAGIEFIDEIVYNNGNIPKNVTDYYFKKNGSKPLKLTKEDEVFFENKGVKIIGGEFVEIKKNYIRHDAEALCKEIIETRTRIYRR